MKKVIGYVLLIAVFLVIGIGIGRLTTQAQQTPVVVSTPKNETPAVTVSGVEVKWIGMFRMGNDVWNETVEMRSDGTFRYYDTKDLDLAGRWRQQGNWPNGQPKLVFKLDRAQEGYNDLAIAYDERRDQVRIQDQDKNSDTWWSFIRIDPAAASTVAPSPVLATQAPPAPTPEQVVEPTVEPSIALYDYESTRAPGYIGNFAQQSGVGNNGFEIRPNGIFCMYQSVGYTLYGKWKSTGTEPNGRLRLLLTADRNNGGWTTFDVAYDQDRDFILVQTPVEKKYHPDRWIMYPRVR